MTLTDFLLARIAEDEAAAKEIPAGSWEDACSTTRRYDHVFRWSPARVLAECEAKRRIVGRHNPREFFRPGGSDMLCRACSDGWPCRNLRDLALPYAEHEDFDPEWTP